jgi:hypothetical protein
VNSTPTPVYTAITDRVLLAFAPLQSVSVPAVDRAAYGEHTPVQGVVPPVGEGFPGAEVLPVAHGPTVLHESVAQFDGLSVPNTTYIFAGSPSLIPASGSSPMRSDTE